jgi:nitronate monooxygenase
MTDKPFGVNITIGLCPRSEEMREVALEEGIKVFETAAFRADQHIARLKDAGAKWIHKVASVKHALRAEKEGADAVVIVGLEGIAFKSDEQLPSLIATTLTARDVKIPVIAGGGFGDARTFLAGLVMGAEAVYMATLFMVAEEAPISPQYKQRLVKAKAWEPDYLGRAIYKPSAEEVAKILAKKGRVALEEWLPELEDLVQGFRAMSREERERLTPMEAVLCHSVGSLAVAFIDKVVPVKEMIESIIKGAEDILARWGVSK